MSLTAFMMLNESNLIYYIFGFTAGLSDLTLALYECWSKPEPWV